ncbi:acyl-CoA dehydrogenase family protein [Streptomyces sp. NPDC102473]|uniref:acyl-CoA dehydrogenase family protein n=1 Tax=Streptomyces sp. NPDC102473 TaxID=3366180 RepID=UPI0038084CAC
MTATPLPTHRPSPDGPAWTEEALDLLNLVRTLAAAELAPRVDANEAEATFPRDLLRTLGRAGLLGLPYPQQYGGGGQPYEVYLTVLETLAQYWLGVAQSVNIHVLSCYGLAAFGTEEQRAAWLPDMLGGELLGANCISESEAGSDIAALRTTATPHDKGYALNGVKSWVSHAGVADYYNVFCRTGSDGVRGLSLLLVPADTPGVRPQARERKMGVRSSPTAPIVFDEAEIAEDRRIGRPGKGFLIAMGLFDRGRLGIAACAVGLAQAALGYAVAYAKNRQQFGKPIISFQGVGFMLADMATQVAAARSLLLDAARQFDAGRPSSAAAAKAKLFATDTAMRVTTDAVQVLGGYGYVVDHPAERWMREAKLLQLVEGTNQIQRLVIATSL